MCKKKEQTDTRSFKTFSIELNKKNSDFVKTRPLVKVIENVTDVMNLYRDKIYYSINEFMSLSMITKDFVSNINDFRLKREHSV